MNTREAGEGEAPRPDTIRTAAESGAVKPPPQAAPKGRGATHRRSRAWRAGLTALAAPCGTSSAASAAGITLGLSAARPIAD